MTCRTTVTWNSILAGYRKRPGKVREARQVFDRIPEPDTVSFNTMLACYLHNSDIGSARSFFDQIPNKDIASWNTMVSGFSQNGMMNEARELFSTMPEKNSVSWNAMISGYVESGNLGSAMELFWAAPVKSVIAWTAMITGYMKFGKVELAEKMFMEMPVKNLVTWNAMISGYVENCQAEDGLKLFRTMVELGVRPNPSSMSSVLLGCSNLSALKLGEMVKAETKKADRGPASFQQKPCILNHCLWGKLWRGPALISHTATREFQHYANPFGSRWRCLGRKPHSSASKQVQLSSLPKSLSSQVPVSCLNKPPKLPSSTCTTSVSSTNFIIKGGNSAPDIFCTELRRKKSDIHCLPSVSE
ncbi:tetratricopeptide repeat (TPR)-like superfamily protein [Actinidia rufa]|uniref:Tetratricopeptide repeat (TPR)-like superfamily protein n=1 Tax=Actinidia rufa TaxID=165716 RepID=A0A7J0GX00_9ERIC|nr:tetratricopeptide repeat (TPR)-like superfamily protein [Actinidia rufa]